MTIIRTVFRHLIDWVISARDMRIQLYQQTLVKYVDGSTKILIESLAESP